VAGEIVVSLDGTVVADPELRFTPSGAAVVNLTIAQNERRLNKESGKWEDGDAVFLRCNAWRQFAENIAESFSKGDRVIGYGRLKQRSYETREGEKRTVMEVELDGLGASVKFRTVQINRADRSQQQRGSAPADDPWGSPPPPPSPRGWGGGFSDEPPYHHSPQLDEQVL
jgi:single-strand DNA-binding protein